MRQNIIARYIETTTIPTKKKSQLLNTDSNFSWINLNARLREYQQKRPNKNEK
jgi:hypothetical protein